jgi:hypothetical protein
VSRTAGEVLEQRLRELGVSRVYGLPLAGLQHVPVEDTDLAVLLADADGRIGHHDGSGRLGAAHLAGPILHLSSCPGGAAPLQTVGSIEEALDALVDPPGMTVPGTLALHLDFELSAPAPEGVTAAAEPERQVVMVLDPSMAELDLVFVVGPGVVRDSAVEDLHTASRAAGAGVVNTWGAKGVERWDSPYHFGTAGLQERDFELAGVGSAHVVIASGLDPDETPVASLGSWVVQEVPPRQLAALAQRWPRSNRTPTRPPLYDTIAGVVTPLYESDRVPLTAARASLHLSGALPERGIAVADPGPAGFWIARTFPTSFPGSVCVPATRMEGFAAAAALVCALEERPCFAVTDQVDGPEATDPTTAALLSLAEELQLGVALQLWGADGSMATSNDHVELLVDSLSASGVRVDEVPVDVVATALERVAGPLRAWD